MNELKLIFKPVNDRGYQNYDVSISYEIDGKHNGAGVFKFEEVADKVMSFVKQIKKEVVLNDDDFKIVNEYSNMRNIPKGEGKRLELELFLNFYKKYGGHKR